ncbi:EF-hand domain-containing protein [Nocardia sp. NPDC006630]|uniref:EF-hand domain-containing protein n=1 Tax=Nocardia sp. NPDC006630 TaxID=3157181 RepID=UPI0033A6E1CB
MPIDDDDSSTAFDLFDTDGDGRISATDLVNAIQGLGLALSADDAAAFVAAADTDGDGLISQDEFDLARADGLESDDERADATFDVFDTNGDQLISLEELEDVAVWLTLYDRDQAELLLNADTDGDQQLTKAEFRALYARLRSATGTAAPADGADDLSTVL